MHESTDRTLVDRVVREIFSRLLSGEIQLGSQLNEAALALKFETSRGPIREAMKQLQGMGLVYKEAFHKARVLSLTLAEIIEVFELREAVEGMSVRLATANMTDAELARLSVSNRESISDDFATELDLHCYIARHCGNERIRRLLCDELYYILRLYRARSSGRPGRRKFANTEHAGIIEAMQSRDADLAELLMRQHIRRATMSLREVLETSSELA